MDNLTHALVGASLAEFALPRPAAAATRRVFMVATVVAASAPDVDLIYTWITEAPLGYLLHHRGHSHTWPGLIVLAAVIAGALRMSPGAWRVVMAAPARLTLAIALALASHLLLDAANGYGTHLLYPFDARWYYGDAMFIFEPWVWLVLGISTAMNATGAWPRRVVWALTIGLPAALLAAGLVPPGLVVALAIGGGAVWLMLFRSAPRRRATVALVAVAVVFAGMLGVSRLAKAAAQEALRDLDAGAVVDIAANPDPGVPWCWSIVTVERAGDDALVVRRGTLSLLPGVTPPGRCALHRLMAAGVVEPAAGTGGAVLWNREWRADLTRLRALAADCRVDAWLQFGRVPFADHATMADLRFDSPIGGNFSAIALPAGAADGDCPSNLTHWEWPRADVLRP